MQASGSRLLLLCFATICGATTALGAPIPVTFGDAHSLQSLVDRRYGSNHIDVTRDYIGARVNDIDPWFWVSNPSGVVRVNVVKRDADLSVVGFYLENGGQPMVPNGAELFFGPPSLPEQAIVVLPGLRARFGFYVDSPFPGPASGGPPGATKRFYTNRLFNDRGPDGNGAIHPPLNGDVQALIFDVSPWAGPDTWLVCFDDLDTGGFAAEGARGANPKLGASLSVQRARDDDDGDADDDPDGREVEGFDFDDAVFEVKADGATLVRFVTFGGLKLLYR
jgi:hypothetical protein